MLLFTVSKFTLQEGRHTRLKYFVASLLGYASHREPFALGVGSPHVAEDVAIRTTARENPGWVAGSLQLILGARK